MGKFSENFRCVEHKTQKILERFETFRPFENQQFGFFPQRIIFHPVEAVAAATSVFTENVFCESGRSAHNLQISSIFQEADCLLHLVKVNKQVFAITLLNRNLNTAQLSIS